MENTRFKVYIEEKTQDYGKIFLEPLERGYGDTLGNALRRLLLSSIRGAAVAAVKIDGVLHEFSTIKGVREDVIEILMNLKQIPIKSKKNTQDSDSSSKGFKIITLDSDNLPRNFFTREENPGVITAKDMPWDDEFEFCGDKILCTLEPDAHLLMEIYVEEGIGYLSAERERPSQPQLPIDALLTDAIFSPVKRVNYQIEPARVGQSIDYERLLLEVWTNGAISPEEAVKQAAELAETYFGQIAKSDMVTIKGPDNDNPDAPPPIGPRESETNKNLDLRPIEDLGLTIRSANCLRRGGIETIGDLLRKSHDDLLKIRNLGKKSLNEIEEKIYSRGLQLRQPTEEELRAAEEERKATEPALEKDGKGLVGDILDDLQPAVDEAQEAIDKEIINSDVDVVETKKPTGKTSTKKKTEKAEEAEEVKTEKAEKKKTKSKKTEKAAEPVTVEAVEPEISESVEAVEVAEKAEKTKKSKTKEPKEKKEKAEKATKTKSKTKKSEKVKAEEVSEDTETLTEPKPEQEPEVKPEKKTSKKAEKASKSKTKEKKAETEVEEVKEAEPVEAEKPKKAKKSEKTKAKAKSETKTESESETEEKPKTKNSKRKKGE